MEFEPIQIVNFIFNRLWIEFAVSLSVSSGNLLLVSVLSFYQNINTFYYTVPAGWPTGTMIGWRWLKNSRLTFWWLMDIVGRDRDVQHFETILGTSFSFSSLNKLS